MTKITVPLLPQATQKFDQSQMAQMVQSLDQLIFALNNTYTPETLRDDDEAFAFFMGDSPSTALASIESDVSTNTSNISTNTSNISTNTTNIATNATNITTNANNITTANGNITTNANAITSANSNITTLQTQVSALQKQVRYLLATK